jgi:hypothetical protein
MRGFVRAGLCGFAISACVCFAQRPNAAVSSSSSDSIGAGVLDGMARTSVPTDEAAVPLVKGFNFILTTSSQHDSPTGWSNVLEPNLSYRFNEHFAVDIGVPFYTRVNAFVPTTVKGKPTTELETSSGLLGDTVMSGQFDYDFKSFWYAGSASMGVPTGDSELGLTANQVTYNVNNHFERTFGRYTPNVEVGIGNSSTLDSSISRKTYVAVGPSGFFEAGTMVDLPLRLMLDMEAYESLPIGDQRVFGTITRKGKTVQVLEGTGAAEDNGFTTSLLSPLGRHLSLMGYYTRSLRQHYDTVGFSFMYTVRIPKEKAAE